MPTFTRAKYIMCQNLTFNIHDKQALTAQTSINLNDSQPSFLYTNTFIKRINLTDQ